MLRVLAWLLIVAIGLGLLVLLVCLPANVVYGDIEANNVIAAHRFYHGGTPRSSITFSYDYHPLYPMILSATFLAERLGMLAVFHLGLLFNWMLWLGILGVVAWALRRADDSMWLLWTLLLLALWPVAWSHTTVLYSETFFVFWLAVAWAWLPRAAGAGRWWSLLALGLWCGTAYLIRPSGAVVGVVAVLFMAFRLRTLQGVGIFVAGLGVGLALAIVVITVAGEAGVQFSSYHVPHEMFRSNMAGYARRVAIAFVRCLQLGVYESYGVVLLAPWCMAAWRKSVWPRFVLFWFACWMLTSVTAAMTVACYPVYQPGYVVGRYTCPFVLFAVMSCLPLLNTLRVRWWHAIGWLVLCIMNVWCLPLPTARLIDNVSVCWATQQPQLWLPWVGLVPVAAITLWLVRRRRWCGVLVGICLGLLCGLNATALWRQSRQNARRLAELRGVLPVMPCPGLTIMPLVCGQNMSYFDYTLLQLWHPAVRIRLPGPWPMKSVGNCDLRNCRLLDANCGRLLQDSHDVR